MSPLSDCKNIKLSYIFHLDKESASQLQEVLTHFLSDKTSLGLILLVNKNSFVLKELTFLGELPSMFYKIEKPFGIWGLPYCVMQFILGGYNYSRYADSLIKEPSLFAAIHQSWMHSALLPTCHKCIAVKQCSGVGNLAANHSMFAWRAKNSERFKRAELIVLENGIDKQYRASLEHITSFSLEKTDRTIRFAALFEPKSEPVYHDRFIYYCNYLSAEEFDAEKTFMLSISKNRDYVPKFLQHHLRYFKRFAFSLAAKINTRETFYGFFISEQASRDYLHHSGILIRQENFEDQFHFFGIDFIDQTMSGYKLYAKIHDELHFFDYLGEKFSFDFPAEIRVIAYDYLLVRRFDNIGKLKSVKIEFLCRDFPRLIPLIEHHFAIRLDLEEYRKIERIAFDISLGGNLNKITLYYTIT